MAYTKATLINSFLLLLLLHSKLQIDLSALYQLCQFFNYACLPAGDSFDRCSVARNAVLRGSLFVDYLQPTLRNVLSENHHRRVEGKKRVELYDSLFDIVVLRYG